MKAGIPQPLTYLTKKPRRTSDDEANEEQSEQDANESDDEVDLGKEEDENEDDVVLVDENTY